MSGALDPNDAELAFSCGLAGAGPDIRLMAERFVNAMSEALAPDDAIAGETMAQGAMRAAAIVVLLNCVPQHQARAMRIAATLMVRIAAEIDVRGGTPLGHLPAVSRRLQ